MVVEEAGVSLTHLVKKEVAVVVAVVNLNLVKKVAEGVIELKCLMFGPVLPLHLLV